MIEKPVSTSLNKFLSLNKILHKGNYLESKLSEKL